MKAILCTHFCTPGELELADIPEPKAGAGEAVVRIKAAALNFFDLLIIAGKYQVKPPFPFSPASEFAGVVESIGAGVTAASYGSTTCWFTRSGCSATTARFARLYANAGRSSASMSSRTPIRCRSSSCT